MIINKDTLSYNFPEIALNNILVDTWFLSKDTIGSYKCKDLTIQKIEQIIVYLEKNNINIMDISFTYWKNRVYSYKLIFERKNGENKLKPAILYENIENLIGITMNIEYTLEVYDLKKNFTEWTLSNSFEIFFMLVKNEVILTIDFQSIFYEDNKTMILLIYLMECGLLKIGEKDQIPILVDMLNKNSSLTNIVEKVKKINGISLIDEQFEYLKYCVMKISNNLFCIENNKKLSASNKNKFNQLILDLGKILEVNFEWR